MEVNIMKFATIVLLVLVGAVIFFPQKIGSFINKENVSITPTTTTTTLEEQIIVDPAVLGYPCNKYGCFPCNFNTDCVIYFDCETCICEKDSGNCKNA